MIKKTCCILVILCLLGNNVFALTEVKKDETVYVNLEADGSVADIRIVNHIYGEEPTDSYTDFGKYTEVKNLISTRQPEVKDNQIKWPMEMLKKEDIYYEGKTDKELPVQLKIKYFMDGKESDPKSLGGQSGHFKIEITMSFSKSLDWSKAGLLAQIQLTPDLDVFKNIVTEGNRVVVGKKATVGFMAFPDKDQSFTLEADVQKLYLDPINITLVPSSASLPTDMKAGLDQLTAGLDQLGSGSKELAKGAGALAEGTNKLKTGMTQLDQGIGELYNGTSILSKNGSNLKGGVAQFGMGLNQLSSQSGQMSAGLGQMADGLETLSQKGSDLYSGLGQLQGGLRQISDGNKDLSAGLNQLTQGHTQLMELASMYLNSSDPYLKKLAEGILAEGAALKTINNSLQDSSKGLEQIAGNMGNLYSGFGEYHQGISQMAGSMKEIQAGAAALPNALVQMDKSFANLQEGIVQYIGGITEVNKGLGQMKANTKILPGSVAQLAQGQLQLKAGLVEFDKGTSQMSKGVKDNLGSILPGGGQSSYRSFADNQNNMNSTVQFVMRTPSIEKPEEKAPYTKTVEMKKGFFQRILDLFGRK